MNTVEDPCYICGGESDFGAHGIKDGEVYSEYFCAKHYNAHDSLQLAEEGEDETTVDRRPSPKDHKVRTSEGVPSLGEQNHIGGKT